MELITNASSIFSFLVVVFTVFGGGIATFFIIKSQLVKVLKEELITYKGKVERLEKEVTELRDELNAEVAKNGSITRERDFLKNLIMEALTTQTTVHNDIVLKAAKKIQETDKEVAKGVKK
jgi:small-conductance mechanosensitive channel